MKFTKRKKMAVGILFLIAGLVIFLAYFYPMKQATLSWNKVSDALGKFEVSAFFNEGEVILLEFPKPSDVNIPLPFNVTIIAPDKTETVFEAELLMHIPFVQWNITLIENDGGLEVEEGFLGGTAMQTGNYTGRVDDTLIVRNIFGGPPSVLTFYRGIVGVNIVYPYQDHLPLGIALIFVGGGICSWAYISKKPLLDRKRLERKRLGR